MNEDQTFEALREILPQLQAKLRTTIQAEYQSQIKRMQIYYQKLMTETINQKQIEYKREMERNDTQLRKDISIMQRERQQWLALQNNYRKTIMELTEKLKQNRPNNLSILSQITSKNNPMLNSFQGEQKVAGWKKKRISNEEIMPKSTRTSNKIIGFQQLSNSLVEQNLGNNYCSQREEQNLLQERPLQKAQNTQTKFKAKKSVSKFPNEIDFKQRAQRQDTVVLSPPKQATSSQMRSSFIQPPNSTTMKTSILKNQQGKKKLLQMIRSIK